MKLTQQNRKSLIAGELRLRGEAVTPADIAVAQGISKAYASRLMLSLWKEHDNVVRHEETYREKTGINRVSYSWQSFDEFSHWDSEGWE